VPNEKKQLQCQWSERFTSMNKARPDVGFPRACTKKALCERTLHEQRLIFMLHDGARKDENLALRRYHKRLIARQLHL